MFLQSAVASFGRSLIFTLALGLLAGSARATWSIVLVNVRTGEVAVASATCLMGDLAGLVPVVVVVHGAAASQSAGDVTGLLRKAIRDAFLAGTDPRL